MDDKTFIIGLMRENTNELGFIPSSTIEQRYIALDRYLIQTDMRGRRIGYLLHGSVGTGSILHVSQAVIDFDFRNRGFGEVEVAKLIERAKRGNCSAVHLRCADDLAANLFWCKMGFEFLRQYERYNQRQRLINLYSFDLWRRLF